MMDEWMDDGWLLVVVAVVAGDSRACPRAL